MVVFNVSTEDVRNAGHGAHAVADAIGHLQIAAPFHALADACAGLKTSESFRTFGDEAQDAVCKIGAKKIEQFGNDLDATAAGYEKTENNIVDSMKPPR